MLIINIRILNRPGQELGATNILGIGLFGFFFKNLLKIYVDLR